MLPHTSHTDQGPSAILFLFTSPLPLNLTRTCLTTSPKRYFFPQDQILHTGYFVDPTSSALQANGFLSGHVGGTMGNIPGFPDLDSYPQVTIITLFDYYYSIYPPPFAYLSRAGIRPPLPMLGAISLDCSAGAPSRLLLRGRLEGGRWQLGKCQRLDKYRHRGRLEFSKPRARHGLRP